MRHPSSRQMLAITLCGICSAICMIEAIPLPAGNQELDLLQIPLTNGREIDVLTLGSKDQEQLMAERNKRTIGLLRQLFPDITKEIDSIVNRIIAQVIRVVGPGVLNSILAGNRGGAGSGSTTPSPDFDSDFDDDDDDDDDDAFGSNNSNASRSAATATTNTTNNVNNNNNSNNNDNDSSRVRIDLPTFAPDTTPTSTSTTTTTMASITSSSDIDIGSKSGATDTQIDLSAINKQLEETIRVARQVKEAEAAAAAAAAAGESAVPQVPIPRKQQQQQQQTNDAIQLSFSNDLPTITNTNTNTISVNDVKTLSTNDLQLSESKSPAIDELSLDSGEDAADLDDRSKSNLFKRFLSFGGAGLAGGSSGGGAGAGGAATGGNSLGAGGGSGNFLLDIVRLFSGSVQTQQGDEAANSVSGGSSSSTDGDTDADSTRSGGADGYTEGIPGPVTRLVVLANRGLANLVQDLILRVAATSEKFVNFKAKLITALI